MIYLTMDLPVQPRPDVPAPLAGPVAIRSQQKMRWIIVGGILSIVGLLLALPVVFSRKKGTTRPYPYKAQNDVRQLHLGLLNFQTDYGTFPDASTIAAVKASTGTGVTLGTSSSNEYLRQLLVTTMKAESVFWAPSAHTPHKPDNDMSGSRALEKGECSFAYVPGLSSSSIPSTPVLMAPVDPAGRCFERKKDYGNLAVVLFVDGSAKAFPVDKHGQVQLNGMDLFDPRQTFWGGTAPDVKWPE